MIPKLARSIAPLALATLCALPALVHLPVAKAGSALDPDGLALRAGAPTGAGSALDPDGIR
jgi:hypothetical protein